MKFLKQFGRTPNLSEPTIQNVEEYLARVFKPGSEAKNFMDLRAEVFHHTKGSSHHNLPPTSQGLLPHIKRSFYNAYTIMHALEVHYDPDRTIMLKPEECGYENVKQQLLPDTSWRMLKSHWTVVCSCAKCAKSTCACRVAKARCVNFCQCKKASQSLCKNPVK